MHARSAIVLLKGIARTQKEETKLGKIPKLEFERRVA